MKRVARDARRPWMVALVLALLVAACACAVTHTFAIAPLGMAALDAQPDQD